MLIKTAALILFPPLFSCYKRRRTMRPGASSLKQHAFNQYKATTICHVQSANKTGELYMISDFQVLKQWEE